MKSAISLVVAGLVGTVWAAPVAAQEVRGFYAGGGIGQSHVRDACEGVGGAGVTCDEKDTALKLFGGYQFNRNLALEIGYADFGKITAAGPGGSASIASNAWELSGIAAYPATPQFSIYGRLGGYYGETRLSGVATGNKDTTNVTFGAGLQYDVSRNIGVRAEWQRYMDLKVRDNATGAEATGDVDVLGISIIVRFQ